ncbi:ATP-dependent DNA helicase [Vibrio campbellii]|uniref:ATP-dependent DNA helicase n=1 Tax=Vibrio campbellii TaxID=680 RepID=UPI000681F543|nr:AAA family ATPase [Vibrio campbellii]
MKTKPTNRTPETETFRVTSIYRNSSRYGFLNGMPINVDKGSKDVKVKDATYRVIVGVNFSELPVKPSAGQHWKVTGVKDVKSVDVGDYTILEHTYSNAVLECTMPTTSEAFVAFIAAQKDFKGIGEKKARTLWFRFQDGLYALLEDDNEHNRKQLAEELTENAINCLYAGYEKYSNLKYANWMSKNYIPFDVQQRLFKFHGKKTMDAIKNDPYRLMTFGLSFAAADKLAKDKFFVLPIDERRLLAAVETSLQKEVGKGHTCIDRPTLRKRLNELLNDIQLVDLALKTKAEKIRFVFNSEIDTYHPSGQLMMETVVAMRLSSLAKNNDQCDEAVNSAFIEAQSELPYYLTSKQCEAVMNALNNNVACITGGAGTGKTTVLRTTVKSFHLLGYTIHAMALSGRAAMRLRESIGFESKTIAAFLRGKVVSGEKQLLVIDESSMVDLPLMYQIITHITPEVRILLVGDPNQLPPIGAGRILADVIASGVIANTVLDIVKRQEGSSGIPEYSNLIIQGVVPPKLSVGSIAFHEVDNSSEIVETCRDLFRDSPDNSRVMAPTKKLVEWINKEIQQVINKDGESIKFGFDEWHTQIRQGDQVLFTKNDYKHDVQNGLLGVLTSVEKTVLDTENGPEEFMGMIKVDCNRSVFVDMDIIDQVQLGYAMSLHRGQGSQFPRVIIALDKARNLDRAWLYTAVTRAEVEVHIVGRKDVLEQAIITPSHTSLRNTYLPSLIRKHRVQDDSEQKDKAESKIA